MNLGEADKPGRTSLCANKASELGAWAEPGILASGRVEMYSFLSSHFYVH